MGKYYWLKLKRDFFKRHDVKIIRGMENGDTKLVIYLALLCESTDHDGRLRFSEDVPYTPRMLASVLDTDPQEMEDAIDTLVQFGLMDMEPDGTYIMTKVQGMIESLSDTDGARRAREFRQRQKEEKRDESVTETHGAVTEPLRSRYASVTNRNESIENRDKSVEIKEKEQEEKEKTPIADIVETYNEMAEGVLPTVLKVTDARRAAIRARWQEYKDLAKFTTVFYKARHSAFLTGQNDRKWTADFDWLMKPTNFTKVLEGKYDDRKAEKEKEKGSFNTADFFKAAVNRRA